MEQTNLILLGCRSQLPYCSVIVEFAARSKSQIGAQKRVQVFM